MSVVATKPVRSEICKIKKKKLETIYVYLFHT